MPHALTERLAENLCIAVATLTDHRGLKTRINLDPDMARMIAETILYLNWAKKDGI